MQPTKPSVTNKVASPIPCGSLPGFSLSERKRTYLEVTHTEVMPDFLMNVVSPQDQWMYITSQGALTAGRTDAGHALFPYYTEDKLIDLEATTGSLTLMCIQDEAQSVVWHPFSREQARQAFIRRSVFKSPEGNEVLFEERHGELDLQFSYLWSFSSRWGFVRQIEFKNTGNKTRRIDLLDGIQNLLPYGLNQGFQDRFSNLADAYKRSELLMPEHIGLYYLNSIPTDRAEPSEGLKATVAWSLGYEPDGILLSDAQVTPFLEGSPVSNETDCRGRRGAYLILRKLLLEPGESFTGLIVADVDQDAGQIEQLRLEFRNPGKLAEALNQDVQRGRADIRRKLASADGYQLTADSKRCARHLSNVLFNIMRGGIFIQNHQVSKQDFVHHLETINPRVSSKYRDVLEALPDRLDIQDLIHWSEEQSHPDLARISLEYLPLTFSRRHGDPSRPWNAFSIQTTNEKGDPVLAYQGNWRDIFQNWEALAYSYPRFAQGMIFRFLNASTLDGYNPYRLTKDGFDWEVPAKDEPWSNIGYWGDHQIIYLLKLLEIAEKINPTQLSRYLNEPLFVFANVPYRIADFEAIWTDPRNTVVFDEKARHEIDNRTAESGADGKLLFDADGNILRAGLAEKLLIPLLAKLSNFVPGGGIWMNTQRPEWNDANNALVGNGLSVVTLCYLHRYIDFLLRFLGQMSRENEIGIRDEVRGLQSDISGILYKHADKLNAKLSEAARFAITHALGQAGSAYRGKIYQPLKTAHTGTIRIGEILDFLELVKGWLKHSLQSNRREDGLYGSYNILGKSMEGIAVEPLYPMLEGQVAILSSNLLTPEQALDLLDSLRQSPLYRKDKRSYMLYPDRHLPVFLEKNIIPKEAFAGSPVLQFLLKQGDSGIVYQDPRGNIRFNGSLRNSEDLELRLRRRRPSLLARFSEEELNEPGAIFTKTFNHESFTGRSGTFFAYEGLGSIYWHMVSKLLLAIQENFYGECAGKNNPRILKKLAAHYSETLKGLGLYDSPQEYGAFPSDAYSHTPKHAGAKQPGMTGQVKEDILTRWGELGIHLRDGQVHFQPRLLSLTEFFHAPQAFTFYDLKDGFRTHQLQAGELAFTFCQVPVVYRIGSKNSITVETREGEIVCLASDSLGKEFSSHLFERNAKIALIRVNLPKKYLPY